MNGRFPTVMGSCFNRIISVLNFLKTEYVIFHSLFVITTFINKYVLSVVGFSYPTVYQGWQCLSGAFLLLYLRPALATPDDLSSGGRLSCSGFLRLLPTLLLYIGVIISGSKTLASLPVGVYVCAGSAASVCAQLCTLKQLSLYDFILGFTSLIATLLIFLFTRLFETNDYYPWPMIFILVSTILEIVDFSSDGSKEVTRLYYRNIFSFVFLMPCSLYLGEAFSALHFQYVDQLGFYSGCILSGISGLLLQLTAVRLVRRGSTGVRTGGTQSLLWPLQLARLSTLIGSLFLFDNSSLPKPLWTIIFVQIMTSMLFAFNTHHSLELKVSPGQENII